MYNLKRDRFSYECRDKKRPVLNVIFTGLAICSAIAFTAGYIYWAVEGSRVQDSYISSSQIESAVEMYNNSRQELSDKL